MTLYRKKALAGQLDEAAIKTLEAVLRDDQENLHAHYTLGRLLESGLRNKEAVEHFRKVVEADPEDVNAWCQLGACLVSDGHYEEAVEALKKAVARLPGHIASHCRLMDALLKPGRKEEAKAECGEFLRLKDLGGQQPIGSRILLMTPVDHEAWPGASRVPASSGWRETKGRGARGRRAPWKRSRRTRGPPPCEPSTPRGVETIDPQCDVDDYFFDPCEVEYP